MSTEFTIEPDAGRYAMHIDGELAAIVTHCESGARKKKLSGTRVLEEPGCRGARYA